MIDGKRSCGSTGRSPAPTKERTAIKIAVDARQVYRYNRRGTGKNLIDLYRSLAQLRPGWQLTLFHQVKGADDPFTGFANVRPRQIDIRGGDRLNLWEMVRLPLAARKSRANVLHCPANSSPRFPLVPAVVTIHDLIPCELAPDAPATASWMRRVARAARKARRILTPSQYSKSQIVEHLKVAPEKITVNPWAPDQACRQVTDPEVLRRARRSYGLAPEQPYVLGFGACDPRKNTRRILEAWAGLPTRLRKDFALLLVGIQEPALTDFRRVAGELSLGNECFLHGFAPEADLPALISGAAVLCYPSLAEGFGLPLLDAFNCGTSVLTSRGTSLAEVAGDAALLVDPWQVSEIRGGLEQLLNDEGLRTRLVARGHERVQRFTWDRCAATAATVFEEAAHG